MEKVQLLDMLKEGRSFAAVGRHYGINESSVRYIKKDEKNIRMTAAVSFNKNAKRVVTNRNKKIVRMESALALWISEEAGLTLDRLATLVRMAKDLQRLAQEWDPHMLRSLQFANTIEGGMTVYKNLLTQKKKQRQQLPITMFLTRKKREVTPTPSLETDVSNECGDCTPPDESPEVMSSDVEDPTPNS